MFIRWPRSSGKALGPDPSGSPSLKSPPTSTKRKSPEKENAMQAQKIEHEILRPENLAAEEYMLEIDRPEGISPWMWEAMSAIIRASFITGYLKCRKDSQGRG
jgi:hypothetical protein